MVGAYTEDEEEEGGSTASETDPSGAGGVRSSWAGGAGGAGGRRAPAWHSLGPAASKQRLHLIEELLEDADSGVFVCVSGKSREVWCVRDADLGSCAGVCVNVYICML
jgi:hypothetical protein